MLIKSDYYNNPDRILIGVDITTHLDIFEENWSEFTGGKDFDWNQDRSLFNNMLSDIEYQIAENFYKKLGHAPVEESHDGFGDSFSTYSLTYWGDRNNPKDIAALESLQSQADDSGTDNGKVNLAIYDSEVYAGNVNSFLDKWGDKGTEYGVMAEALVDAITVGVDFPEEFDSDPMYDRVGGMNIKNSKEGDINMKVKVRVNSSISDESSATTKFAGTETDLFVELCGELYDLIGKYGACGSIDEVIHHNVEFEQIADSLLGFVLEQDKQYHKKDEYERT